MFSLLPVDAVVNTSVAVVGVAVNDFVVVVTAIATHPHSLRDRFRINAKTLCINVSNFCAQVLFGNKHGRSSRTV